MRKAESGATHISLLRSRIDALCSELSPQGQDDPRRPEVLQPATARSDMCATARQMAMVRLNAWITTRLALSGRMLSGPKM